MATLFQSLIGIMGDFNCPGLKAFKYVVFKVRLRQSKTTITFQARRCQY